MRDGGVPFLPPEQGASEVSPRARETTMFQGEVALPLPMAEEGSESARQAPVFYEGASHDGKYAGANEKYRPRSPGNEIPPTARVDWVNGKFPPHKRSFICRSVARSSKAGGATKKQPTIR